MGYTSRLNALLYLASIASMHIRCTAATTTPPPSSPLPPLSSLVVDLGYSLYEGYYNATIDHNIWQGIRYAAPPTGENRWRAPQAPTTPRDRETRPVLAAKSLPERCPQTQPAPQPSPDNYTGSEDCLFLSVYAPAKAVGREEEGKKKLLPVWVWIHGGGYGRGRGDQDIGTFATVNRNRFVSVVIQYRLGALGFLAGDEVKVFGDVNVGLLDQHFALQWVQEHMAKFGGDPRRVTVSGQSAGGGSVMLQAMAYGGTLGSSLFRNAIAATPYSPPQYHYSAWQPSQAYYALAAAAGCFPGRAYGNTSATILDCLREVPSDKLQRASAAVGASGKWGTWAFVPVTDGDFVRHLPSQQLRAKKVNGERILTSNTANEAAAYVIPDIKTDDDFEKWLRLSYPLLTEEDLHEISHVHYPPSHGTTVPYATCGDCRGLTSLDTGSFATGPLQRAINLYSDSAFICASYWLAEAYSPAIGKQAFTYQYSIPAAQHGADLNALGLRMRSPNISPWFQDTLINVWGNMIVENHPFSSDLFAARNGSKPTTVASDWPQFVSEGENAWQMLNVNQSGGEEYLSSVVATLPNVTQLRGPGLENDIRIVDAYSWEGGRGARCEFWREVGERIPQ